MAGLKFVSRSWLPPPWRSRLPLRRSGHRPRPDHAEDRFTAEQRDLRAGQSFTFEATASNAQGIATLALYAGAPPLWPARRTQRARPGRSAIWHSSVSARAEDCTGPGASRPVVQRERPCRHVPLPDHTGPADPHGHRARREAGDEAGLRLHRHQAADHRLHRTDAHAGSNPPVAAVSGTSPVAVAVTTSIPLASVTITSDNGTSLEAGSTIRRGRCSRSLSTGADPRRWRDRLTATRRMWTERLLRGPGRAGRVPTIQFTLPTLTAGTNRPSRTSQGRAPSRSW